MVAALTLAALLCGTPPEARKETGVDALGVPLLNFNTDVGLGFGAVGGAYFYAPGHEPYQHAIAAQAYFTTGGVQNHWLRYDGPQLLGRARLEGRLEWRREFFTPYYGAGNVSSPGVVGERENRDFSYDQLSPGLLIRVRNSPLGEEHPLQPYVGYGFRWYRVDPYPDSRLERDAPLGLSGGPVGQAFVGVLYDTRDAEGDPTQGGLEEVSLRLAGEPTGSRYSYGGVTASERRYFRLGTPRLIFAQRLSVDYLFGQVPFFEWTTSGGTQGIEGIGGMGSVRGVARNRFGGTAKAVSNSELRFYPFDFELLGAPVKVGGLVFFDLGRAWHPGVEDGAWYRWHPGIGGGLRVARREAVLRFDYAAATETWRQAVYVAFGHVF